MLKEIKLKFFCLFLYLDWFTKLQRHDIVVADILFSARPTIYHFKWDFMFPGINQFGIGKQVA